jgi:hypothetical protein
MALSGGSHSVGDYVKTAAIGGAEGAVTGLGISKRFLGGGREVKLPNKFRFGSGKWFGGKGRPWYTRLPHYHRGATNKLRDFHRPWQRL